MHSIREFVKDIEGIIEGIKEDVLSMREWCKLIFCRWGQGRQQSITIYSLLISPFKMIFMIVLIPVTVLIYVVAKTIIALDFSIVIYTFKDK